MISKHKAVVSDHLRIFTHSYANIGLKANMTRQVGIIRLVFILSAFVVGINGYGVNHKEIVERKQQPRIVTSCLGVCKCDVELGLVDCSYQDLDEIPDVIPDDVITLNLNGNNIRSIRRADLSKKFRLKSLFLSDNEISVISQGSFDNLFELEDLDLNGNLMTSFSSDLFVAMNSSLRVLNLGRNLITNTSTPMFSIPMKMLVELHLNDNLISVLNDGVFQGLSNLKVLNLNLNVLKELNSSGATLTGLENLEELFLNQNFFFGLPVATAFSHVRNTLLHLSVTQQQRVNLLTELDLPVLEVLNVSYCRIFDFKGNLTTPNLVTLDVTGNELQQLSPSKFLDFHRLKTLNISQNSGFLALPYQALLLVSKTLENLAADALSLFRITGREPDPERKLLKNLRHLSLQYNAISVVEDDSFFANLHQLESLAITHTYLIEVPPVFEKLTNLKILHFDGNPLTNITSNTFPTLPSLEDLSLNEMPELDFIGEEAFSSIPTLRRLTVKNGKLSKLSRSALNGLNDLKELDLTSNALEIGYAEWAQDKALEKLLLSGNEWRCDCNMNDFRSWLISQEYVVIDVTDDVTCHFPRSLRGYEISTLDESELICEDTECPDVCLCYTDWNTDIIVDCSSEGLSKVPSIPLSSGVVQMTNNPFVYLTAMDFYYVHNITKLSLSSCMLEDIENVTFSQMMILSELDLNTNKIQHLKEEWFESLENLESLRLDSNWITSWDAKVFHSLQNLKFLDLSKNAINSLDKDMFTGLVSLERLLLNENSITVIPTGVFDTIPSIQVLYIPHNRIEHLPPNCLQNLAYLTTFDAGENLIQNLDDRFLISETLQYLKLEDCQISSVGEAAFAGLPNLRTLRMAGNKIKEISLSAFQSPGYTSLVATLDLNDNQLTEVPVSALQNMTHLSSLYLSKNPITSLQLQPNTPCACPSIETLQLAFLPITEVPQDSIIRCFPNLRVVIMNNCALTQIPSNLLHGLENLKTLNLDDNQISLIHQTSFPQHNTLSELSLRFNQHLTQITDNAFSTLGGLIDLRISECTIDNISPSAFEGVTQLEILDVSNNKLTTPSHEWYSSFQADKLTSVSLYNNPWLCNCSAYPYQQWLLDGADGLQPYSISTVCDDPIFYKGVAIESVDLGECSNIEISTTTSDNIIENSTPMKVEISTTDNIIENS
ncbi:uncharacterized protein LOC101242580, partial [Ciona intestinalis]